MDCKEIGKRIKESRNKLNITQKQLAELSKIDATSISRYENGAQIPNLYTLIAIATSLEISLDYLIFGKESDFKLLKKEKRNSKRIFYLVYILFWQEE